MFHSMASANLNQVENFITKNWPHFSLKKTNQKCCCIVAWSRLTLWFKLNFCYLKMKSVLNILGYFLELFERFSWGLKPLKNLQTCIRICPKLMSTDFIFIQQEIFVNNQNCQAGFRPLCNKILLSNFTALTVICNGLT